MFAKVFARSVSIRPPVFVDVANGCTRPSEQGVSDMPQYLLSVWHDDTYELDFSSPDAQRRVAQVGALNGELQGSGVWVFGAGLHPASSATVVRSTGGEVSMTDGPYAET